MVDRVGSRILPPHERQGSAPKLCLQQVEGPQRLDHHAKLSDTVNASFFQLTVKVSYV
jgi:hypothetical protein